MAELYDHVLSDRCYTVRLALALLGVDYLRHTVEFAPARQPASTGALQLDSNGDPPVYVEDGRVIAGVPAILDHLFERHDQAGKWRAADPEVRAWLDFAEGPLAVLSTARSSSLFGAAGDLEALRRAGRAALRTVEDRLTDQGLSGRLWLAGETPTLADIAVFPSVMLSHDSGIGHEDYPAINLWQRRMRRLEDFVSMPGIPDYF